MMRMSVRPAATASSTTYWIDGLSTTGSISFGWLLVAGRNRVPRPAAGMTAFLIARGVAALAFTVLTLPVNSRHAHRRRPVHPDPASDRARAPRLSPVDGGSTGDARPRATRA